MIVRIIESVSYDFLLEKKKETFCLLESTYQIARKIFIGSIQVTWLPPKS